MFNLHLDYYDLESVSDAVVAYFNTSHCAVTFTIGIQKVCKCMVCKYSVCKKSTTIDNKINVCFYCHRAQRNTLVQTCPDQELTAVTYPKTDMTDRDLHKSVVITETGVKEYTAYVQIGYQCLSDIMIIADNVKIEMMTVPFSMLIFLSIIN